MGRRSPKSWGAWALVLFSFGFIFAIGRTIGRGGLGVADPAPAIAIDPRDLDFGEVWENPEFEKTLMVKNDSDDDVTIQRFQSSCACTSISPASLTIPARGTAKIVAKLDLVAKGDSPPRVRDFSATIFPIVARGVAAGARWEIHGVVRCGFTIADGSDLPAETFIHGQPVTARTIFARCLWPAARIQATTKQDADAAQVEIADFDPESGKFSIAIQPRDEMPVGRYRVSTLLEARDETGRVTAQRNVIIPYRIASDIELIPDRILLGRVKLGDSKTETVTVTSRSGQSFDVLSVAPVTGHGLSVEPLTEATLPSIWKVRQESTVAGAVKNRVVFEIRYAEGQLTELVEMLVAYEGFDVTRGK